MPQFSAFTRFGFLRFSKREPIPRIIYRDMIANQGGNYSTEEGSRNLGRLFARAMAFGRAQLTLERAGNQFRPLKAREMLPSIEWEFGLIPTPTETIRERQSDAAAAAKIARGARLENVRAVLQAALGDAFLAFLTTAKEDLTESSSFPGTAGTWERPGSHKVVYRIVESITHLGTPQTVTVELVAGDSVGLKAGQTVSVDLGRYGRAESVGITAAIFNLFQATFSKPHDAGTLMVTGRAPNLSSTKRQNLVILTSAGAADPEIRRKAHRSLRKLMRGVSTWSLAESNGLGTAGPFRVGEGKLGATPIGAVTY